MRFLILFICLVCVYDIYCTVKYQDFIGDHERNLIARMLIIKTREINYIYNDPVSNKSRLFHTTTVDVSLLVAFKCLGLLAAADILEWVYRFNTPASRSIIYIVTMIQAALLIYLTAA